MVQTVQLADGMCEKSLEGAVETLSKVLLNVKRNDQP